MGSFSHKPTHGCLGGWQGIVQIIHLMHYSQPFLDACKHNTLEQVLVNPISNHQKETLTQPWLMTLQPTNQILLPPWPCLPSHLHRPTTTRQSFAYFLQLMILPQKLSTHQTSLTQPSNSVHWTVPMEDYIPLSCNCNPPQPSGQHMGLCLLGHVLALQHGLGFQRTACKRPTQIPGYHQNQGQ